MQVKTVSHVDNTSIRGKHNNLCIKVEKWNPICYYVASSICVTRMIWNRSRSCGRPVHSDRGERVVRRRWGRGRVVEKEDVEQLPLIKRAPG